MDSFNQGDNQPNDYDNNEILIASLQRTITQLRAENKELRREIGELRMSRKMRGEEIESLRQQLAEAQKDAERYRWLRHGDNDEDILMSYSKFSQLRAPTMYLPRNEKLDTAIDAAMNGEK